MYGRGVSSTAVTVILCGGSEGRCWLRLDLGRHAAVLQYAVVEVVPLSTSGVLPSVLLFARYHTVLCHWQSTSDDLREVQQQQ
jgi:hypothetical protein